ncbi:MazG nucleotide pyrophosphohydrolase domain-containing protein [Neoactinobaculum massilliense]|uniref:MazG nucleotide pyrophosphohydrolase domain-containing protein n=1 Tax=Neoactinobaculum massilliense TaxID=2364794 RepID=UPI000F536941|nr:MazG nucleotide pyrophosphohydrolase domain-containing protein [Neoactinobaculum massilliense]
MDFHDMETRALEIRHHYEEFEQSHYGRTWTDEELVLGLMGDVGDLAKLVQAAEGVRNIDDHEKKLGHELADCLWAIIILAYRYNIDLATAFGENMDVLQAWLIKHS